MQREPRRLDPKEPTKVAYINPWILLIFSVIFAVVFFGIGSIFRHYVWIGA